MTSVLLFRLWFLRQIGTLLLAPRFGSISSYHIISRADDHSLHCHVWSFLELKKFLAKLGVEKTNKEWGTLRLGRNRLGCSRLGALRFKRRRGCRQGALITSKCTRDGWRSWNNASALTALTVACSHVVSVLEIGRASCRERVF